MDALTDRPSNWGPGEGGCHHYPDLPGDGSAAAPPTTAIVAPAPSEAMLRRMAVVWGLQPVLMVEDHQPGRDRIGAAVQAAVAAGAVPVGALVVALAGHPIEGGERLPTLRLVRVGEGGRALEP